MFKISPQSLNVDLCARSPKNNIVYSNYPLKQCNILEIEGQITIYQ